jgi:hypothetical protein
MRKLRESRLGLLTSYIQQLNKLGLSALPVFDGAMLGRRS